MIRFACPSCKRVLSGRDGYAGKIVTCPKCGFRMQVPQPESSSPPVAKRSRNAIARSTKRTAARWPMMLGLLAVGLTLVAGSAAGIWYWRQQPESEPTSVASVGAATKAPAALPVPPPRHVKEKMPVADAPKEAEPKPKLEKEKPPELPPRKENPPRIEDKKPIDLADDMPAELEFQIVEAVNGERRKEKREPIFLDAEVSRGCQAHAEYLALNAARLGAKGLEQTDEDAKLPGVSDAGRQSARTAISTSGTPSAAIAKWLKEPARRAAILEPRLRTFGAGFARNVEGQWFSVFDWKRGIDALPPMDTTRIKDAIVYPAPGQMRVPLWFPGNEVPDPLPEATNKLAGYPVTLTFPPRNRVENVKASLSAGDNLAVWLSTPEKPANPQHDRSQQNTICLIAKEPLQPNRRHHVEVEATLNGQQWSAKWDFETVSAGEIHYEMAGRLLRTLNNLRRQAGLVPIALNAELSKACAAHALYLGKNAPTRPELNWNEEKPNLPGYSEAGAAVARRASIQGGGGPLEAVDGLVDSLISRPQVLDPHLRELALGYTPFALGGWIWVMELRRVPGPDAAGKEYLYPAPNQESVPLFYPASEIPSPIPPDRKGQPAGYAITATFSSPVLIKDAAAKLTDDKGAALEGWLSTPEKPAITGYPQRFLCYLPRDPLRPATRYTATFTANLNGQPWERTWSFTTLAQPDRFAEGLEERLVAQLNAARKAAGLNTVRLDEELSRGCQAHARYLVLNQKRTEGQGLAMHRENPELPGATPEGARAAKESVIAVVLDPQSCVEGWLATLYHRIPALAPNVERVGFAHARLDGRKWVCILDMGNGRSR